MDDLDIVSGTGEAAFAANGKSSIVAWNKAAERLLGYEEAQVLGRSCHRLLCGTDSFGNRFCDKYCPVVNMVRRHEPVRNFELDLRGAAAGVVRTNVSIIVASADVHAKLAIIHLLRPVPESKRDPEALPSARSRRSVSVPVFTANGGPLTSRETEVLQLLADGAGTREIARLLFISVTTVRNHIQNISRKLGVHSRLQAVCAARRSQLI